MAKIINGVLRDEFIHGYCGEANASVPFKVDKFLKNRSVMFKLERKKWCNICFTVLDDRIELRYSDDEDRRILKLFREWPGYSLDDIIKLESVALGNCVRKIIDGEPLAV